MNLEEHLREYRNTLDAATEAGSASHTERVAPPVRIRPTRTLVLAAVTVAAAAAIAFAAVGALHRSSSSPAGSVTATTTSTTRAATPISTVGSVAVPNVVGEKATPAAITLTQLGFVVKQVAVPCRGPLGVVTKETPAPGSRVHVGHGGVVTITICTTQDGASTTTTLPVVICPTEYGNPPPRSARLPASLTIASPPFASPALSGYSDGSGHLTSIAPTGWGCRALDAADGGVAIDVTPPGVPVGTRCCTGGKLTRLSSDGVFADSVGCVGCVFAEACSIVPGVDTNPDFAGQGPCPKVPAGQHVSPLGNNVFRIDDPPGTLGPDAAHSILRYTPASASGGPVVTRETCVLPASQLAVCNTLLDAFRALNPGAG
jgi:hypothetical protein